MTIENKIPDPPYYAVIFTSERTDYNEEYEDTATRMLELAAQQPGYLGVDSVRDDKLGITVSYWQDLESIKAWSNHVEHSKAKKLGREHWYRRYSLKIARVVKTSLFEEG